jgi:hypothetical protein
MVNWHHSHVAATRIPAEEVAFGLRQEHFMVEIVAGWKPDGNNAAAHRRWRQDLWESLTRLHCPAATLTCWSHMIANKLGMLTPEMVPR